MVIKDDKWEASNRRWEADAFTRKGVYSRQCFHHARIPLSLPSASVTAPTWELSALCSTEGYYGGPRIFCVHTMNYVFDLIGRHILCNPEVERDGYETGHFSA